MEGNSHGTMDVHTLIVQVFERLEKLEKVQADFMQEMRNSLSIQASDIEAAGKLLDQIAEAAGIDLDTDEVSQEGSDDEFEQDELPFPEQSKQDDFEPLDLTPDECDDEDDEYDEEEGDESER